MNKIVNIGLTALFACFVAACENDIDNYDAPNGSMAAIVFRQRMVLLSGYVKGMSP